jgi:hypothetical protein
LREKRREGKGEMIETNDMRPMMSKSMESETAMILLLKVSSESYFVRPRLSNKAIHRALDEL